MKIHLIKRQTIEDYVLNHAAGKSSFENWLTRIKYADWHSPGNIKQTFGSADLLGKGTNRVVFNIGGNDYRIICKYKYGATMVHLFICWIGTHERYLELCDQNEQYTVNDF
jgi:mRNA interferase HigB